MTIIEADVAPCFVPDRLATSFDRESMARHLRSVGLSFDPAQPIRQFAGGLANRNYLVELDGAPAVLRRPPEGILPPGAHDMGREHRITSRLSAVLPFVPRSIHFCADTSVIGVPFQLIEYRSGLVIRGSDISPLRDRPEAPVRLCKMLIELMAALHATDAAAVGLQDLGRPTGFLRRNIKNWTERGLRVVAEKPLRDIVLEISGWLDAQYFEERSPTVLHCDLKLDNVIIDPATLTARAVVDWDMGTRGDPLFDLATLLSYWAEPGDPECLRQLDQMPTASPGFWSRDEAAQRYSAITGRRIDDLHAIRVVALLKLGIVFLQLHGQWVQGAVNDPRYRGFRRLGEGLLLHTRDIAKGIAQ